MRISDLIKNESHSIKWIKDEFGRNNLFVDNGFQRRYVWLLKHKVSLIETILMGYVIPEIYIWEVGTNAETGDTKYSIVDGQQRIGAIVGYINDEYSLEEKYVTNTKASYVGKMFSELSPEEKKNIWGYSLSFRKILDSVDRDNIISIFLRLNSTDKSLNPQELRNAEYDGLFLKNAIDIANLEFWSKNKVFSAENMRRMGDVEFISSILIFFRKGIESEISQDAINNVYDLYNEKYDEATDDKKIFESILEILESIIEQDKTKKFLKVIRKKTHLYTIIVSLYKFIQKENHLTKRQIENIIAFFTQYEKSPKTIANEYKELCQGGTRSKQNRIKRVKILYKVIDENIFL